MNAKINNIAIRGISSFVPENMEDNMDFVSLLGERKVKKQIRLTGIRKRHTSVMFQMPSDLAAFAAEKIIAELNWNKHEIGVLIFVTQEGDYILPSTAIRLQERLGLSKECIAFDINLGCSAFNYGVHTAATILNSTPEYKKGLCLIADRAVGLDSLHGFNKESVSLGMLFGSAASAVALEKEENSSMIFYGCCDGSNYDAIVKTGYWRPTTMKGNVIFDFAINDVANYIIEFKKNNSLSEDEIDFYVFHQAQKLMLESVVCSCGLPPEKVLYSMDEYGNTSGASVPLTINANAEIIKKKPKVNLLLCGFGVGLSCGITYFEMNTEHIMTVDETDDLFDIEELPKAALYDTVVMVFNADEMMGQFLSELLDMSDASLILCGQNEEKLKSLQQRLHRKDSAIISYTNNTVFKEKLKRISEKTIDGIVNITDDELAKWITEQSFFSEQLSVVLVDSEKNIQNLDYYETIFREKKENARVNMVCYTKQSLELFLKKEGQTSWAHKFLQDNLPSNMIRPNYLYNSVEFLLYQNSRFISGSIIKINDSIKWF